MLVLRVRTMIRTRAFAVVLAVVVLLAAAPVWAAGTALDDYLARPDAAYEWHTVGQADLGRVTVYDLVLTSQVWHGITWRHNLSIYVPKQPEYRGWALLLISGGGGPATGLTRGKKDGTGVAVAQAIGAPAAVLTHVPNQPLFGDRSEDKLISYTFAQYFETGDATWPLLLPMTKSAVRAMDAVQAFAGKELGEAVSSFVVAGGSKRGWTTWLTAASGDARVKAIVPMVFDMLDMPAQLPHQKALWGDYSAQIADYTERGLQDALGTPRGRDLVAIVDPYSYRRRLALPKLLINGANDPYWATDALTLYWRGLRGPKAVLDVPNAGHGLEDWSRVLATASAFFRAAAGGARFPQPAWRYGERGAALTLTITSTPAPVEGRIWAARSQTKDFRRSKWEPVAMTRQGDAWVGQVRKPQQGNLALFGEVGYIRDGKKFTLSTAPRIWAR